MQWSLLTWRYRGHSWSNLIHKKFVGFKTQEYSQTCEIRLEDLTCDASTDVFTVTPYWGSAFTYMLECHCCSTSDVLCRMSLFRQKESIQLLPQAELGSQKLIFLKHKTNMALKAWSFFLDLNSSQDVHQWAQYLNLELLTSKDCSHVKWTLKALNCKVLWWGTLGSYNVLQFNGAQTHTWEFCKNKDLELKVIAASIGAQLFSWSLWYANVKIDLLRVAFAKLQPDPGNSDLFILCF